MYSAVPVTPSIVTGTPLRLAAVENADSASRDLQVKLVAADIAADIGRLNYHGLAGHRSGIELELVAFAAIGVAVSVGGKTVGNVSVHYQRTLVAARVGWAIVAAALRVRVGYGFTVFLAAFRRVSRTFAGPSARRLTAVPVSGSLSW